jgi:hypothetical protein
MFFVFSSLDPSLFSSFIGKKKRRKRGVGVGVGGRDGSYGVRDKGIK